LRNQEDCCVRFDFHSVGLQKTASDNGKRDSDAYGEMGNAGHRVKTAFLWAPGNPPSRFDYGAGLFRRLRTRSTAVAASRP